MIRAPVLVEVLQRVKVKRNYAAIACALAYITFHVFPQSHYRIYIYKITRS